MITPEGLSVADQIWWGQSNFSDEYNETLCQIAREEPETEARNKLGGLETANYLRDTERIEKIRPLLKMWKEAVNHAHGFEDSENKLWGFSETWSHITSDTAGHYVPHQHGTAFWCGVYYPKAPEGSGILQFCNPVTWQGTPESGMHGLVPVAGRWIIFPPHLLHWANPNEVENVERICFAFNSLTTGGKHLPHIVYFNQSSNGQTA